MKHATDQDSLARAKADLAAERAKVTAATGLRFTEDGQVVPRAVILKCVRCRFHAAARTEGAAIRSLAGHLVWHAQIGREG